jgi:hypothetical protein
LPSMMAATWGSAGAVSCEPLSGSAKVISPFFRH